MSNTTTQRVLKGVKSALNQHPSAWNREGHYFSGWNTEPDGSGTSYSEKQSGVKFLQNVTLYAMWTESSWTISYNMNGHGSVPEDAKTSYISGDLPYSPPTPERVPNYLFLNWTPAYIDEGETGDKTFTANWIYSEDTIPGQLTVALLDTSGSMSSTDYGYCAQSIFLAQNEYLCQENSYAKIAIYHGTQISNIQTTGEVEELDISHATWTSEVNFYNSVRSTIQGIEKAGGGEYMLLCLYYAINDIITKYLQSQQFVIGQSDLKGINFMVLTDENVFTTSSFNATQYKNLVTQERCPWIYNWQNSNATYKFPSSKNSLNGASQATKAAQDMVAIFKQISYYYGVNMTFGLSESVSLGNEQDSDNNKDVTRLMNTNRVIPYVTKTVKREDGTERKFKTQSGVDVEVDSGGSTRNVLTVKRNNSTITSINTIATNVLLYGCQPGELEGGPTWILPDGIAAPTDTMMKITYYGADFNNTSGSANRKVMIPSDIYADDVMNKLHYINGQYFQFRFNNENVKLPIQSELVQGETRTLSGWKEVGRDPETIYSPGQTIQANGDMVLSAVWN